MKKEQNNAYIDIINLELSYTADFDGSVQISAGYCDLHTPNNNCVTVSDNVIIIQIKEGETIKISNVVDLKMIKFESKKN